MGLTAMTRELSQETAETQRLYGLDNPLTEPFGRRCLMAWSCASSSHHRHERFAPRGARVPALTRPLARYLLL